MSQAKKTQSPRHVTTSKKHWNCSSKSLQILRSQGAFVRKNAMKHAIHRVTGMQIVREHTIEVQFADGTQQTIDFQPVLVGEMYGPLLDRSVFNRVRVDPEIHTLVWPNGADFDPTTLHDWPVYEEVLRERAPQWTTVPQVGTAA